MFHSSLNIAAQGEDLHVEEEPVSVFEYLFGTLWKKQNPGPSV